VSISSGVSSVSRSRYCVAQFANDAGEFSSPSSSLHELWSALAKTALSTEIPRSLRIRSTVSASIFDFLAHSREFGGVLSSRNFGQCTCDAKATVQLTPVS